jgi:hypothetical protein
MTRERKKIVLAAIIVGLLLFIAALSVYLLSDEAPPNDSDLLPRRQPLPEAENGIALLPAAALDLSISPEDKTVPEPFTEAWQPEPARAVLARNAEALERYDRFLEKGSRLQAPEVTSFNAKFSYLYPWRHLALLASMRLALLVEDGKEREAIDECLKLARYGRTIERADGGILVFLVGTALQGAGVQDAVEVLARSRRPAAEWRADFDALARHTVDREAFAEALRAEYRRFANIIDALADGSKEDLPEDFSKTAGLRGPLLRLALKRNETKRLFADTLRPLIRSALDGKLPEPEEKRPAGVSWWPPRNVIGRVIHELTMFSMGLVFEKVAVQDVRLAQARLAWALKAFHESRGDLPASLAELVPDFLDAVPADPFDGEPLRYSKEKRMVWSIGKDRIDAGGSEEEDDAAARADNSEPTLRLERFLRPPDAAGTDH